MTIVCNFNACNERTKKRAEKNCWSISFIALEKCALLLRDQTLIDGMTIVRSLQQLFSCCTETYKQNEVRSWQQL